MKRAFVAGAAALALLNTPAFAESRTNDNQSSVADQTASVEVVLPGSLPAHLAPRAADRPGVRVIEINPKTAFRLQTTGSGNSDRTQHESESANHSEGSN